MIDVKGVKSLDTHSVIRASAVLGMIVLGLRRLIYVLYPAFLSSRYWHPDSFSMKWISISANSLAELVLTLTLLGVPCCLYIALRNRRTRAIDAIFLIDFGLSLLLYSLAYFLLSPPKSLTG